jgi:hypothetical protein
VEIDVTAFLREESSDYSASHAELGDNAGPITWQNAMRYATESRPPLLATSEALEAFRDDVEGYGAWSREEIDAWSPEKCNALFAQILAGAMRDGDLPPNPSEEDWAHYESEVCAGCATGALYRGNDGRAYYYLGT